MAWAHPVGTGWRTPARQWQDDTRTLWLPPSAEEPLASPDHPEKAHAQALCWLLDELLNAEVDLLALVARPGALVGWRERLRKFCLRLGEGVQRE